MTFFPVSSSILSAAHLSLFLREKYGFGENPSCKLIKAGINHTYLVTSGDKKYVFRIYSHGWRTRKEITEEIRLTNYLHEGAISVSIAVADFFGSFIQELPAPEGNRLGVMFTYANGEKNHNFSREINFRIGEIMAQIHKKTCDFSLERVKYTPQVLIIDSFELLKQFVSEETDEMIFMASTQKHLLEEFDKINFAQVRKGAVHLDIWFDNLHIDSQDKISIFDFDFCGNGFLCLDIAYYLLQLFVVETDENEHKIKLESFIQGYESVTKISEEEKRILPMLGISLYFFYLGVQCERFENWSNVFINDVYLKRYISARIKKYFDYTKNLSQTH